MGGRKEVDAQKRWLFGWPHIVKKKKKKQQEKARTRAKSPLTWLRMPFTKILSIPQLQPERKDHLEEGPLRPKAKKEVFKKAWTECLNYATIGQANELSWTSN